ncbi:MAG TPA: helix-turn-helix domain-containing protein [Rectinemataceae bacterium]|nr:helix-turn-helix domain-containing protein [Rectinemataceae bacterium]
MLHPVRMRIVQALATRESVNATELCEKINDVPRTTLYRHINILLDSNILSVVSETKIRGSLERTLALNRGELSKHNTLENASGNALRFLMDRYAKFHNYFSQEHPGKGKDMYFFNTTILMMNDAEFDRFLAELRELLIKYSFETEKGRKPRDISIISSPVEGQ